MDISIHRFTDEGIRQFEVLLEDFRQSKSIDSSRLRSLTSNKLYIATLETSITLSIEPLQNKYDIAKTIATSLQLSVNTDFYNDSGLWSWLAASLLEMLVPINKKSGEREFKEKALYVLNTSSWNRYYRHLLAFPCWIFSGLEDKGLIFLRGSIYERGEIVEQLAAVNEIQRNLNIVEAATILFYNPEKRDIVKGAASKNVGGTVRRFREVIQQVKLTYDLNAMTGAQISSVLPAEFDKWKR